MYCPIKEAIPQLKFINDRLAHWAIHKKFNSNEINKFTVTQFKTAFVGKFTS